MEARFILNNGFNKYRNLAPRDDDIIGDITMINKNIDDNSVSCCYSHDVFEHIQNPFKAAAEIYRFIKPGGLVFVDTLFSWREHGCPNDYFRYTKEGLKSVFGEAGFEHLFTEYDYVERRRNIVGKHENKIKSDSFGGYRENIRVRGLFRKN